MNTEQAISELECFLNRARGVDGSVSQALLFLAGEARAMADVRTLDEWERRPGRAIDQWRHATAYCQLVDIHDRTRMFEGLTPEDARREAARGRSANP